jgi:hypothetical protein
MATHVHLSGVTAVQGTNAATSIRMAFEDVNAKGGINGRKIRFIAEDMEYMVPKAVQAMNKLDAANGCGAADDDREAAARHISADLCAFDVSAAQSLQIRAVCIVL